MEQGIVMLKELKKIEKDQRDIVMEQMDIEIAEDKILHIKGKIVEGD